MPILNDALAALDTVKEADIAYIKKLANPPGAIKLVMEGVCVMLDVKPAKVRNGMSFQSQGVRTNMFETLMIKPKNLSQKVVGWECH